MMFAILAEHDSDVETIRALVRRVYVGPNVPIKGKGFNGGSELLRSGAAQIRLFKKLHLCDRFIICHDGDEKTEDERRKEVFERVILESGILAKYCAVVPMRSIESWMLADSAAVGKVFSGWKDLPETQFPEKLSSPKNHLEHLTRKCGGKYRYSNSTHNQRIAEHISLDSLLAKCGSFKPLFDFVRKGVSNVPHFVG